MRHCVQIGLLLTFLLLATYAIWIQLPEESDDAAVTVSMMQVEQRFEEQQKAAEDPAQNGYLNTDFHSYWSPAGGVEPDSAGEAVEALAAFYLTGDGVLERAVARTRSEDPHFEEALERFQPLVEELIGAWSAPCFVVPREAWRKTSRTPRVRAMRQSAQALAAYGQHSLAQGDSNDAMRSFESLLFVGRSLIDQSLISAQLEGVALQSMAFEAVVESIQPGFHLSGAEWLLLARSLESTIPPADSFYRSVLGELALFERFAHHRDFKLLREIDRRQPLLWLTVLPGMMERERRLIRRSGQEILEKLEEQKLEELPTNFEFSLWDWLVGRTFLYAAVDSPNFQRAAATCAFSRDRLVGLYFSSGLMAHRNRFDEFPERLSDLQQIGLTPPNGISWNDPEVSYRRTETGAVLRLALPEALRTPGGAESRRILDSSSFYRFDSDALEFHL